MDIKSGKNIFISILRAHYLIGKQTPIILVRYDLPYLAAFVRPFRLERYTEHHPVQFAGLEGDFQLFPLQYIIFFEIETGILVLVGFELAGDFTVCLRIPVYGSHV